jgi:hypothetical protein
MTMRAIVGPLAATAPPGSCDPAGRFKRTRAMSDKTHPRLPELSIGIDRTGLSRAYRAVCPE